MSSCRTATRINPRGRLTAGARKHQPALEALAYYIDAVAAPERGIERLLAEAANAVITRKRREHKYEQVLERAVKKSEAVRKLFSNMNKHIA